MPGMSSHIAIRSKFLIEKKSGHVRRLNKIVAPLKNLWVKNDTNDLISHYDD